MMARHQSNDLMPLCGGKRQRDTALALPRDAPRRHYTRSPPAAPPPPLDAGGTPALPLSRNMRVSANGGIRSARVA